MEKHQVIVIGACGKMGREIVKTVLNNSDMQLVGALDISHNSEDIGALVTGKDIGVMVDGSIEAIAQKVKGQCIVVDFTHREAAIKNIPAALKQGFFAVVGTTGLTEAELKHMEQTAKDHDCGILVAANFSLGAVLMMKYAAEISRYLHHVEIIEYHNSKKVDSPSGTALVTAKGLQTPAKGTCADTVSSFRGGEANGIHIHSVRLPSLIAHQEVIFSGEGELLTIRHDSLSRESFMPGICIALRKVTAWRGMKTGLDSILD